MKDLVSGLDEVMHNDLMGNIQVKSHRKYLDAIVTYAHPQWFFTLHDKDKDGMLTKDELLQLSESLLVRRHSTIIQPVPSHRICYSSYSAMNLATRTLAQ